MLFSAATARTRPSTGERTMLCLGLAGLLAFGVLVEIRSAFLVSHMGDLGCYLRGAWAVRTGANLYDIIDFHGWHYNYPPLLAILLAPLADPPPGADHAGMVPYAVSVAVWYVLSLIFLALAVHWLAGALEEKSTDPSTRSLPRGCRRWWALRVFPILICLVPMGHSLMRGQVNLVVLWLFCGMIATLIRGQRFRSGLCLAGTICIKLYPAFLLLYPLWRRDGRCLAGCALGLFVGLFLIPLAVFGPTATVELYQSYTEVLIRPALGMGTDMSRSKELTHVVATDSQSFQAALHNTLHPDRSTRPREPSGPVRAIHWFLGGLLTLTTLLAAGRCSRLGAQETTFALGTLTLIMLLISPVCHLHYFVFAIPLIMGFLARRFDQGLGVGLGLIVVFTVNMIAEALPNLPGMELWRDLGLAMYGAMLLWVVGIVQLWKRPETLPVEVAAGLCPKKAAA
jgi:hypothetical protein